MKIFHLFLLFLLVISCNKQDSFRNTEDCATSYALDDPQKEMEGILTAKIRFVVFKDSIQAIDTQTILESIKLLNNYMYATNKKFELDTIETSFLPFRHEMQSFLYHAQLLNKDAVFNVYVYSSENPRLPSYKKNIKGEAADIPSRSVAMREDYLLTSTFAHEIGHCLGLLHVHQQDDTDGYTITSGDLVCDTKAFDVEKYVGQDCKYTGPDIIAPDKASNYECNIMSYIPSACRNCLTDKQLDRIDFIIQNTSSLRECFGLTVSNI